MSGVSEALERLRQIGVPLNEIRQLHNDVTAEFVADETSAESCTKIGLLRDKVYAVLQQIDKVDRLRHDSRREMARKAAGL